MKYILYNHTHQLTTYMYTVKFKFNLTKVGLYFCYIHLSDFNQLFT